MTPLPQTMLASRAHLHAARAPATLVTAVGDGPATPQLGPWLKLKAQPQRKDRQSGVADRLVPKRHVNGAAPGEQGGNRMDQQDGVASSSQQANSKPHPPQPLHAAASQLKGAAQSRKVAILVDLLHTDSHALESKVALMSSEIDDEAIGLLEERLQAARLYMQQGTPAVQQVESLYHLLKRAHQRRQASPAMRLLDDVLELLGDGSDLAPSGERAKPGVSRGPAGADIQLVQAYEQRRFKARSLLRDAFTRHERSSTGSGAGQQEASAAPAMPGSEEGPRQTPAATGSRSAAAAAEGDKEGAAWPAKGGSTEAVAVDEFLRAAAVVLEAAERQQRQLKKLISGQARDIAHPARVDKQLQQALAALEGCTMSVSQLEDVLTIARSLRVCPFTEQD